MLHVPVREHTNVASTKAVILVRISAKRCYNRTTARAITDSMLVNRSGVHPEERVLGRCPSTCPRLVAAMPLSVLLFFPRYGEEQISPSLLFGPRADTMVYVGTSHLASIRSRRPSHYPSLPASRRQGPRYPRGDSGRILRRDGLPGVHQGLRQGLSPIPDPIST